MNEPKLRPIGDHVVVRVAKDGDFFEGTKIRKPDVSKNHRPQKGEVLAVGPGVERENKCTCRTALEREADQKSKDLGAVVKNWPHANDCPANAPSRVPMQVKPGDVVWFARFAGHEVKEVGEDLLVMSENDILAVVEG